jgi:hypothetical protein
MSKSAPNFLCSSTVYRPPDKAYLLILSLIYFGLSINSIFGVFSLLDILDLFPARPEKKDEYKLAGFL